MHIENYEWVLYVQGCLSKKRQSEIEEHMMNCDECLYGYVNTMTNETIAVPRAVEQKRRWFQPKPMVGFHRWAAMVAMVMVFFIGISFTPQGQIVLANIRTSFEQFGNSLTEFFGVVEKQETIETLDVASVEKNGVEIKVDQVFVEADKITVSLYVASELIEDLYTLQVTAISIDVDGETVSVSPAYQAYTHPTMIMTNNLDDEEAVPVQLWVMEGVTEKDYSGQKEIPVHLQIEKMWHQSQGEIEGPWGFDFTVDGTLLARETKTIPLDNLLVEQEKEYKIEEMTISPVRTRITVERMNPILWGEWEDVDGNIRKSWLNNTNLMGFIIRDNLGHETEIAQREYRFLDNDHVIFDFFSGSEENPYSWLKEAEQIELLPYFSDLYYRSDQPGLRRFKLMDDGIVQVDLE